VEGNMKEINSKVSSLMSLKCSLLTDDLCCVEPCICSMYYKWCW